MILWAARIPFKQEAVPDFVFIEETAELRVVSILDVVLWLQERRHNLTGEFQRLVDGDECSTGVEL